MRRAASHDKYGYLLEMGLGKTAIALNDFMDNDDVDLCVVVAPQSFKLSWVTMAADYGLDLFAGYWPRDPLPVHWASGLYVLNYEAVSRSKAKEPLKKLFEQRRVMLVLDESKALGNPQSGWTKSSIELAKRATMVRLLNGTPVTQSPQDLYGQLRALGQLNGMLPVSFRNRFCVLGGYMGKQIMPQVRNEKELAGILDSCTFRALKADWRSDLPPKLYATVELELTARQRAHYKSMLEDFYTQVGNEEVSAEMVITQLGKLRQIASGVLLADESAPIVFEPAATNPKVQATIELVDNDYGKTIVVHYHKVSGRLLLEALDRFNPAFIHGNMAPEEVVEQKAKFNNDPTCRVIVGQERATALGHTLLGQAGKDRCTRTVFFESSFSLYYRAQLEDRNHRGDADEPVTVYDLVASPVERAVLRALMAKRDLADSIDDVVAAVREARRTM
jgi:SNF2 family DNA or RNA helicase